MGCIYKIYNISNNKIYIGKTVKTAEERFSEHIKLLKKGLHYNKEMQKDYDENKTSFRVKKLHRVLRDEDLSDYERYFIRVNKAVENGYNIQSGG